MAKIEFKSRFKKPWQVRMQTKLSRTLTNKRGGDPKLFAMLGYSVDDLRGHLERQFKGGMGWHNYAGHQPFGATGVWVIDHIVCKTRFCEADAAEAFALSNLRPLWFDENLRKGTRRTLLV